MILRFIFFVFFFGSTFFSFAYEERNYLSSSATKDQIGDWLILNQKWVGLPSYSERGKWDALLGDSKAMYIKRGEKRLDYKWQVVNAMSYIEFETTGERQIMEIPFKANNTAIAELFMAELAEGKGRFITQLINGVFYTCEMTSWSLSAHLTAQRSHRSLPDRREHVIDLTAGAVGSMLSWIHYFFNQEFDKVDPSISIRMRYELNERIIKTFLQVDHYKWMAFNLKPGITVNNWNPWCNSNVLQTFMLIENNKDTLVSGVLKTMQSVDKFINYVKGDGACEEGPSYWGHAAGKLFDYLDILSDATGQKISLFNEPMIKRMGEYFPSSYVGNNWVVNFADASAKNSGDPLLIYRYGKAVDSKQMKQFAAFLAKQQSLYDNTYDILRVLKGCEIIPELLQEVPSHKVPWYTWYPETQFCYMNDNKGFFVSMKAGHNNESHNHNDVGTFSLYSNTLPVFIDVGVGTYTRQTFNNNHRYKIWTMKTDYHNLPTINGEVQSFGMNYKAKNVSFYPSKKRFSADISGAYPSETGVLSWIRSYTMRESELIISDSFSLEKMLSPNIINFLTWGQVEIKHPGEVRIQVGDENLIFQYDAKCFDATIEHIELTDIRLSKVWGNRIYRLQLKAKMMEMRGTYNYRIKKIKI